jgi:hypothetical protein
MLQMQGWRQEQPETSGQVQVMRQVRWAESCWNLAYISFCSQLLYVTDV